MDGTLDRHIAVTIGDALETRVRAHPAGLKAPSVRSTTARPRAFTNSSSTTSDRHVTLGLVLASRVKSILDHDVDV